MMVHRLEMEHGHERLGQCLVMYIIYHLYILQISSPFECPHSYNPSVLLIAKYIICYVALVDP